MDIGNIRSIGSYAIANMTTTYKLNLGKVSNMEPNALYNLPNLLQTFLHQQPKLGCLINMLLLMLVLKQVVE